MSLSSANSPSSLPASYSHRGAFYTLKSIPRFDGLGLVVLPRRVLSPAGHPAGHRWGFGWTRLRGHFADELEEVLHVRSKNPLLQLVQADRLQPQDFEGLYLYLAKQRPRRQSSEQHVKPRTKCRFPGRGIPGGQSLVY